MDDDLLTDYQEFVDEVSSDATKNIDDFGDAVDICLLYTSDAADE